MNCASDVNLSILAYLIARLIINAPTLNKQTIIKGPRFASGMRIAPPARVTIRKPIRFQNPIILALPAFSGGRYTVL